MTKLAERVARRLLRSNAATFEQHLRDYIRISDSLIWQRQGIFLSATLLAAFYIDGTKAFLCYSAVLMTEFLDMCLSRAVHQWKGGGGRQARRFLAWVIINTILSAGAICAFVVFIALSQEPGQHFTPLFFLFAAALFAAMNNHQFMPALVIRLVMYGAAFMFITLLDIWRLKPPIDSDLWLQFFTVVFVMYFIIDCSMVYLRLYRQGYRQLERLRAEHDKAIEAYKVKTRFIATVSHELRTPLTSIKGSLDLINSGSLGDVPQSVARMLAIAGQNCERLGSLINDVLDVQKIESGQMQVNWETVGVESLIREAVDANRGYAQKCSVKLALDDSVATLRGANIRGERRRLMQVMSNLISNAAKFSQSGKSVVVGAEATEQDVHLWVQDWGIGIPEGSSDKVFGQFSQVDSSDQRQLGGTGLGMNITKQIVELHGGTVTYDSTLGEGTTFHVHLPSAAVAEERVAA